MMMMMIIIRLFDSLQLSGVLLGTVDCVSATPHNRWAVLRLADNCTFPMQSGTPILRYQVFAHFDMLPRAPITISTRVTFGAPWLLQISNVCSWYFSTFSSSVLVMHFWSAGTAMPITVHLCVSLCTRIISGRLYFSTLLVSWAPACVDGHVLFLCPICNR